MNLPDWAQRLAPVDMDGAAFLLGVSRRFLVDALKLHPHYERRGAKKVFYPEHIEKLKFALAQDEPATHRDVILSVAAKRIPADKLADLTAFFADSIDGTIYFIRCMDRVKVGFTNKIDDRIRVLGTACPYPIEIIATFPGSRQFELFLHRIFEPMRRHGEWFECGGTLGEVVEAFGKLTPCGNNVDKP